MSYVTEGEEENTIVVKLTAKDLEGNNVDSTNGIITVTFNSAAMTLTNVLVNGDYISINETDGFVTFGYVKMDGFEANDVVATLVFEVLDETDSGVTVIYDEVNDAKHGFSEDLGLGDALLGDVNGDGKIDTIDAKMVMQYDLGLLSEDNLNLAVADVNGDGKVNTTDAKLIMQYDLDLIEKFPAED
jgi:hypothetical protein